VWSILVNYIVFVRMRLFIGSLSTRWEWQFPVTCNRFSFISDPFLHKSIGKRRSSLKRESCCLRGTFSTKRMLSWMESVTFWWNSSEKIMEYLTTSNVARAEHLLVVERMEYLMKECCFVRSISGLRERWLGICKSISYKSISNPFFAKIRTIMVWETRYIWIQTMQDV